MIARRRILSVAAAIGAVALVALPAAAQRVSGRVVRPGGENPPPVPGAWVVLHRIGHDTSGAIDSMRTNARGEYTFDYARPEGDSAIYLVSSSRGGVAYFSPPIRAGNIAGTSAEVMVFDTTSGPVHIDVQGRHFIVARAPNERDLQVLEVYELSNDSSLTAISPPGGRSVWSAIVPKGAHDFRVGEGDVSDGAMALRDGRVHVYAPIAPGLKQLSFRYQLPRDAFPLSIPITEHVGLLEIVSDDPGAMVTGAGLRETRPVESEGRTYKRFLAQDVEPNTVVRVALSGTSKATRGATIALLGALFTAAAAGAVAVLLTRSRRRAAAVPAITAAPESRRLVRAIAELDEAFERSEADGSSSEERRVAYESERRELKAELRGVLAGGTGER